MITQNDTMMQANKRRPFILFASSILITLFLFFIDEGYYNFNWMSQLGNWIPFAVYLAAIFSGQMLFSELLLKKYRRPGKTLLSILGGTTTGIIVVIYVIFIRW